MKVCTKCNVEKELVDFVARKNSKSGYASICKKCGVEYNKQYNKNATLEQIAKRIYGYIKKRCNADYIHKYRPKYKNISLEVSKEDFIKWYVRNYFEGCQVDRIDDTKNYSIDNIQLLIRSDHNAKRALENGNGIVAGLKRCSICKISKKATIEFFNANKTKVSNLNPLGLKSECKECARIARRESYKKKKGVYNV